MKMYIYLAASLFAMGAAVLSPASAQDNIDNAVLVHGAVLDGSGWRAVHDLLVDDGMSVTIVQLPLTSLEDDVAATRNALARQDGPTVLVGSSYGGAVISVAGSEPNVSSLVYVAALQPDVGESVADLNSQWPMESHGLDLGNNTHIVDPSYFHDEVAADLPEDVTRFMAAAQRPTDYSVYTTKLTEAAWHQKPSFALVSAQDRTLSPDMLRFMYDRSGATVVEIEAAHLPHISHPAPVAELVLKAAGRL